MQCNVAHSDNAPIRNAGRASSVDPVTLPHNLHRPCSCRASKMSAQLPAKRCMTVSCINWTAVNTAVQLVLHAEHAFAALLDLLLYAQLVCVSALLLSAVHSSGVQAGIAPALQQRHCQYAAAVPMEAKLCKQIHLAGPPKMRGCSAYISKGACRVGPRWTYFLQIILSWLYFLAKICRDGSMMPPRRRITRWRVESAINPHCQMPCICRACNGHATKSISQQCKLHSSHLSPQNILTASARLPAAFQRR